MDLLSKAVSAPFEVGSAIRGARVFHPRGALFDGTAQLTPNRWALPGGTSVPARVRLSRGIGTPGRLPDVLGLAMRLSLPGGPWDLLLATAYVPARVALVPARTWASARYSTLTGYRTPADPAPRWILATPESGQPVDSASIDDLSEPLSFAMHVASARGEPVYAGTLRLEHRIPEDDSEQPSFDPVVNCPAGVEMWPAWLARLRRVAYAGSRHGRAAARTRNGK